MKKIVFATLMCIATMSAKAQILTTETVKHVYEEVSNQSNSDFVYNVDRQDNNISADTAHTKILTFFISILLLTVPKGLQR